MTRPLASLSRMLLLLLLASLLAGCGKEPLLVHQYILEYPAPAVTGPPLAEAIKVERFQIAQPFDTTAMVYRADPYRSDTYKYNRWRVTPGYLVTDYLLRDLRAARLFKAVFSPDSSDDARYLLQGGVEEFQEIDEADGWKASLALSVTLLDLNYEEVPQRVVFQKSYRLKEPMPAKTPEGLAQGMSLALEQLSGQIIREVYRAAQSRPASKKKS